MGIIGGNVAYRILQTIAPRSSSSTQVKVDKPDTDFKRIFGEDFFAIIQGKTVLDFGCGGGRQAVGMALMGAGKVIGLDIQERLLALGRSLARQYLVADRCVFTTSTDELVDIIVSKDAFEHFSDPSTILPLMCPLLKPSGFILAAFGPTWLHPYGGHLFSVFPWAHLLFTENALIRWRSDFRSDNAKRFSEVEGGLNQLTIKKFEQIVNNSPCHLEWLETVPIKDIGLLKHRVFREICSSIVRCKLTKKETSLTTASTRTDDSAASLPAGYAK